MPRMQDTEANCGVYATRNALFALGIVRTPQELERALRTTVNGTDLKHIVKYLSGVEGCDPVRLKEKRSDVAALKLRHAVTKGRPVIITWYAEQPGDHWVAAIGLLGDRFLIADSGDLEVVLSVEIEELLRRWGCPSFDGVVL